VRVIFLMRFKKMEDLGLAQNITLTSSPCTAEVAGLSVGMGIFGATAILACVFLWCRRPVARPTCPYCEVAFDRAVLREHLQGCEEHLKHYVPQGRGGVAQEMKREVFYERSARKLPLP